MTNRRIFAVIPAAGLSRRMGQPKLVLPVGASTVIGRVLTALQDGGVTSVSVVVRRDDIALQDEVRRHGVDPLRPEVDPTDMRASIEHALNAIEQTQHPTDDDAWLLLPADHPVMDAGLIQRLIARWQMIDSEVLIPTYDDRRGHPLIARWSTVADVRRLPADIGVNAWLRSPHTRVTEWPTDDPRVLCDLDCPEDYARLVAGTL